MTYWRSILDVVETNSSPDINALIGNTPATNHQSFNQADHEASLVPTGRFQLEKPISSIELGELGAQFLDSSTHETSTCPFWQQAGTKPTSSNHQSTEEFHGSHTLSKDVSKPSVLNWQEEITDDSPITLAARNMNTSILPQQILQDSDIHLTRESSKRRKIVLDTHIQIPTELNDASWSHCFHSECGINNHFTESNRITTQEASTSRISDVASYWEFFLENTSNFLQSSTDSTIQKSTLFSEDCSILEDVSKILRFDVDAFSHNEHLSEDEKARAELIIQFIKDHKHDSHGLSISEVNRKNIYGYLMKSLDQGNERNPKELKKDRNLYEKIKSRRRDSANNLAERRENSFFKHLISKRHLWYSFWRRRAGIHISKGNDTESFLFQRDITLLMVYIDIIQTIIPTIKESELNYGKGSNETLLEKECKLASESKIQNRNGKEKMKESNHGLHSTAAILCRKEKTVSTEEFETTFCHAYSRPSMERVWKWIACVMKSLKNESLNKIFFKKDESTLNHFIQVTLNNIFFHSIPKLNQRLAEYERMIMNSVS
jgi:hypothetical protein